MCQAEVCKPAPYWLQRKKGVTTVERRRKSANLYVEQDSSVPASIETTLNSWVASRYSCPTVCWLEAVGCFWSPARERSCAAYDSSPGHWSFHSSKLCQTTTRGWHRLTYRLMGHSVADPCAGCAGSPKHDLGLRLTSRAGNLQIIRSSVGRLTRGQTVSTGLLEVYAPSRPSRATVQKKSPRQLARSNAS